jgi:hypothetical protein
VVVMPLNSLLIAVVPAEVSGVLRPMVPGARKIVGAKGRAG